MNQDMDRNDKHLSSEPMPGTSRSLMDLQENDGFGEDFGRKCLSRFYIFCGVWFE